MKMKAREAMRDIRDKRGMTTRRIANMLNKPDRYVNDSISDCKVTNISIEKMNEILRVLEYKVVLVPCEAKIQNDWYELTN